MRFSKSETTTQKEEEEISRHYLKSNYWIDWTKALNMITEEWMKLQKCTYKRSDWRRSKHVDEKTPPYLSPQKIDDRKTKQFPIFNIIQEKESKKATTTTLLLFRLSFIYINKIFFLCSVLLKPIVLACPGLLSSLRMKIPVKNSLTYTRRMYIANFFVPKNYRNSMTDEVCEKKSVSAAEANDRWYIKLTPNSPLNHLDKINLLPIPPLWFQFEMKKNPICWCKCLS